MTTTPQLRSVPRPCRSAIFIIPALLASCCAIRPSVDVYEGPFAAPTVTSRPGVAPRDLQLIGKGLVQASASKTLGDALKAVADRRKELPSPRVFVVILDARGWWSYEFDSGSLGTITIEDFATAGLPLAANPKDPETYVVDSAGTVARLAVEKDKYFLRGIVLNARGEAVFASNSEQTLSLNHNVNFAAIQHPDQRANIVTGFVVPEVDYHNYAGNVHWTSMYAFRPDASIQTLSAGLKWMSNESNGIKKDIPIHAVGSRHAWSRAAESEGVSVLPEGCKGISQIALATESSGPLFRVLAGVQIRELNEALQKRDFAIPYLGGFDGQTVGGVFATGTQGSVLAFGPLADLIRSIDLVCYNGDILRIEPARLPVTNGAAFAKEHPEAKLVVNDELFDAVRIGLGAFGVIHSLVLEVVPKYWLTEVRTLTTFNEVRSKLSGGKIYDMFATKDYDLHKLRDRDYGDSPVSRDRDDVNPPQNTSFPGHPANAYHFELLWNPYGDIQKTLVTTRHWVDRRTRVSFEKDEPSFFNGGPGREIIKILDPRAAHFERPGPTDFIAEHFGSKPTTIVELLADKFPTSIPFLIDVTLNQLIDEKGYTQRSYNVFDIGEAINLLPALSATISVPLKDDLWLKAACIMHETAERLLKQNNIVETSPIALRFVAGSSALLADNYDVCKFEIVFGGNSPNTQKNANILVKAFYDDLRKELDHGDVRLHFGQLIPPGTLDTPESDGKFPIEKCFPGFAKWKQWRDQLDPEERGMTPWLKSIMPK